MANSDHIRQKCLYEEWMNIQEQELLELQQAARLREDGNYNESNLKQLIEKIVVHFQDYIEKRSRMARRDVTPFFAPTWCSSLENSGLWIGGCRPSSYVRLIYALCGLDIESHLAEFLQGSRTGNIGDLSGQQIEKVDRLRRETIRKENNLSSMIASLQEDMVDQPLVTIARKLDDDWGENRDVEKELEKHGKAMASVLEEADMLRLNTVKEIVSIFTPAQTLDFLAAGKKLRLCVKEWGKKKDHEHGRN